MDRLVGSTLAARRRHRGCLMEAPRVKLGLAGKTSTPICLIFVTKALTEAFFGRVSLWREAQKKRIEHREFCGDPDAATHPHRASAELTMRKKAHLRVLVAPEQAKRWRSASLEGIQRRDLHPPHGSSAFLSTFHARPDPPKN